MYNNTLVCDIFALSFPPLPYSAVLSTALSRDYRGRGDWGIRENITAIARFRDFGEVETGRREGWGVGKIAKNKR